jgi:hypothetical protein
MPRRLPAEGTAAHEALVRAYREDRSRLKDMIRRELAEAAVKWIEEMERDDPLHRARLAKVQRHYDDMIRWACEDYPVKQPTPARLREFMEFEERLAQIPERPARRRKRTPPADTPT